MSVSSTHKYTLRINAVIAITALVDVYARTADEALDLAAGLDDHCLKTRQWYLLDGPKLQLSPSCLSRAVNDDQLSLVDVSLFRVNDGQLGSGLNEK